MRKYFYVYCLFFLVFSQLKAQDKTIPFKSTTVKNTYISVFNQLQNDEYITINFSSSGCFHQVKELITIGIRNNEYYLVFNNKRKLLTPTELKAVQKFENELSQQRSGGCTTTDNYTISYNGNQQYIVDGSCNWNGYYKLKKMLGFEKQ